jgi:hypothetical protein
MFVSIFALDIVFRSSMKIVMIATAAWLLALFNEWAWAGSYFQSI